MGPIEIAEINNVLRNLAKCDALKPEASEACEQAALLLEEMREMILRSSSEDPTVEHLKFLLAQQGEG
jgi:hypothetical protein